MKRIILLFAVFFAFGIQCAFASDMEPVLNNTQVVYSPSAEVWSNGSMIDDRIVLTKKVVSGTGNYSQYFYSNGNEAVMLGSDYEFLYNGRLIASHNAELKFFEVVYNDKKFEEKELTQKEIQEIFPDTEIIKISQFNNGKINVQKPAFKKKSFLLLNDTDNYFHKYSFNPLTVKKTPVAGLFEASVPRKITYSHYNDNSKNFPKYIIYVKNSYFK